MGFWDSITEAVSGAVDVIVDVVGAIIDLLRDAVEDLFDTCGTNDVGSPKQPCPHKQKPPKLGDLVVTVVSAATGKPIEGATVEIQGPQSKSDKTDSDGKVKLDPAKIGEYTVEATATHHKAEIGKVTVEEGKSAKLTLKLSAMALKIDKVDTRFAPGAEKLKITYTIAHLESQKVTLKILSDKHAPNPVFERELLAAEKVTGKKKTLIWDGKASVASGALAGKFVSPLFSPYKVVLVSDNGLIDEKSTKVEFKELELKVAADASNRLMMNDPEEKMETIATVKLNKSDGSAVVTPVEVEVTFSFSDPGSNNTTKAASFVHSAPKALGKRGDATAIHWEAHPDSTATSADGFKTKCKAKTITASGADQGKAKINFKPSGVGKDDFKVKAELLAADNTTVLVSKESTTMVVHRKVDFPAFEMSGQTHITNLGTNARIRPFYNGTFVEYNLGAITTLSAKHSIKYFGLWDHAADAQKDWSTWQNKIAAETATAAETTAANGAAGAARTTARAAIGTKANAWRDRIINQYNNGLSNWATDAGVSANSMVGAEFEHPKYSVNAPNADSVTSEWSAFAWLRITVEGRSIHPDRRWVNGLGVATGGRAYVLSGDSATGTKETVAHEAGHESKNQFERKRFGPGDHSASAGLMDPTGSRPSFTAAEVNIFRGFA